MKIFGTLQIKPKGSRRFCEKEIDEYMKQVTLVMKSDEIE